MPRPKLFARKMIQAAIAAVFSCAAVPVHADTDTEVGANGDPGANGTVTMVNNGGIITITVNPGSVGGYGFPASAFTQSIDTDTYATSTATGGNGGDGGKGAVSGSMISAGGDGGAGGAANAFSDIESGEDGTVDSDTATGGNGGNGGNGGSSRFSGTAVGGRGGIGGNSEASAGGTITPDEDGDIGAININLSAIGGNGGAGGAAHGAGGDGGTANAGPVTVTGGYGNNLSASVYGGSGGAGGGIGGTGGDGASESLLNIFNVPAGNFVNPSLAQVTYIQTAQGGASGGSNGGDPGLAGNASSSFAFAQNGYGAANVQANAYGGNGGLSANTAGSAGGVGNAVADFGANSSINASISGVGGTGSEIDGGSGSGGAGGTGMASFDLLRTIGGPTNGVAAGVIVTADGRGGNGGSVTNGASGNGGDGGGSFAGGEASTQVSDGVNVSLQSRGGNGGQGEGAGFAGGNGGVAGISSSDAAAIATGAPVTVSALLIGGDGGNGINGAIGGNGMSMSAVNTITGVALGKLTLSQTALGGSGGGSDGAGAGVAGDATSSLTATLVDQPNVVGLAEADGGFGGDVQNCNGANGGNANSTINLSGSPIVTVTANANAIMNGHGSNITSGLSGFTAGNGGAGSATSSATGNGTVPGSSEVKAYAQANGQSGGSIDPSIAGNGGAGGAGNASATASGAGPDSVQAITAANGGAGGQGEGIGFNQGNGGNATASSTAINTGSGSAGTSANCEGGASKPAAGSGATAGAAGSATSIATSNAATGAAEASAEATGGAGAAGTLAAANATASAISASSAEANATANGSSGSVNTTARANATGLISFVQTSAVAPTDTTGDASANSQALLALTALDFVPADLFHSAAYAIGNPLSADVTSDWPSSANVRNAFNNNPANVTSLMLESLQADTAGSPNTHSAALELNENSAALTASPLIVGIVQATLPNGGISSGDSLRFRVERNGQTLVDQTFTNNAAALTYFQNTVLDLGPQNAGPAGANLDVQFLFDFAGGLTTGTGFGAGFLVGNGSNSSPVGTWAHSTGASWAAPGDWSANTLPDGPGVQSTFGSAISAPQTVTLDENTTIGAMQFSNANSYTISSGAGGYSLALDNAGSPASITVTTGSHTISAPITLTSPGLNATIASGSTLSLSGKISGSGPLSVTGPGKVAFGSGIGEVALTGLTLFGGGTLDLNNNHIILNYGASPNPVATIRGYLVSGYAGGTWTGPGIDSSAAALPANNAHYGVGYADGADGIVAGLTSGQIEIMYTLYGDANLDGVVNGDDFTILAANIGKPVTAWDRGNFNYDGAVNGDDFTALVSNIGKKANGTAVVLPASDYAAIDAYAEANGLMADVPEPASTGLLTLGILGALAGRRRFRTH